MGWDFPRFPQDRKFPKIGKFPNLGNFPGIPIQEIPGRGKFEATWEGGNRKFPLNIPARLVEKSSYGCKFAYSNGAWAVSGAVARVARDAPTSDPTPALQTWQHESY